MKKIQNNGNQRSSFESPSQHLHLDNGKIKSELVHGLIVDLHQKGINWQCIDDGRNWAIIVEPYSQKRIKLQIDTIGGVRNSVAYNTLAEMLKRIQTVWKRPFDPEGLNEETLTGCGWHSYDNDKKRESALITAILAYGKGRVKKALQVTLRSPWVKKYRENIKSDINFVGDSGSISYRRRDYDRLIYVRF